MWQFIFDSTLNLLIGIIGGVFSSLIVSYIFLVGTNYKNQLNSVNKLFDSISGIIVMTMTYNQFKESKGKKKAREICCINDYGHQDGTTKTVEIMHRYWNEITSFYTNYQPWDYEFELKDVLNEISDIISDGKYLVRDTPEDYEEISQRLEVCVKKFEDCERNYINGVIKRILTSRTIHIFEIILACIVLLLFIAA